jgi:hypothetical protein
MKSINHKATVSTITAKVDGSVGYRINTPELTVEEKSAIFGLQNQNVEVLITPEGARDIIKINTDLNQKSQSQRIRAVLFILYKQNPEDMTFEEYYQNKTEKYIESLKARIEE